ncbi:MAG: glycosyltransferase family 4 protein [Bacteroides sp.]|nr:glycosyltransferase family 4 protein [Bacteroides sp.]
MKKKVIRISTVPLSLDLLLKGQLKKLSEKYEIVGVSSPGEELKRVASREGVRTAAVSMERRIAPFKDLIALFRLIRLFRKEKPWMVHSLTPKAGLLAMTAAWLCKVPVRIHLFTGLVFPTAAGIKQKILITTDRLTCRFATHVQPEGKGVAHDLTRFHITRKPLHIIGNGNINGIDLTYFDRTPEVLQQAGALKEEGITTYCFVGRIVGDKGIKELTDAFVRLYNEKADVRLLLVGPEEAALDPLPAETWDTIYRHPAIKWVGWQSDIRPYLAASDVFVFPSYREGFPNVVLQAGAMGLPCIVTDINGCNEIIEEGTNGRIVPPADADALFQAMKETYAPEYRSPMAKNARRRIAERYEQQFLWRELVDWYQSLEKYTKNK